jgi:hypothetical protein
MITSTYFLIVFVRDLPNIRLTLQKGRASYAFKKEQICFEMFVCNKMNVSSGAFH